MKKWILSVMVMAIFLSVHAQPGTKPAVKPVAKPVAKPAAPVMKTILDSASYAIGTNVGTFYKQQGLTQLNASLVMKGINDMFGNKQPLFDDNTANVLMNRLMNDLQKNAVQKDIKEGEAFLAENKKRKEVKVTASGLQYEIIKDTVGYKPTLADTFVCHYRGRLLNGSEFDNSFNRGQPLVMPLSKVIPGWQEALQLMSIGSKYKFYIPYQLGYGLYGNGPSLPGGAMLIFDMELVDVKKYVPPGDAHNNQ